VVSNGFLSRKIAQIDKLNDPDARHVLPRHPDDEPGRICRASRPAHRAGHGAAANLELPVQRRQ
jgi:hypothetical protein